MGPIVRNLIIKRFRSIPTDRIALDNPTFLVGRNGSGKSNVVDVFAFLSEATASPLQAVFDSRGGISAVRNKTSGRSFPPNLGLGVEFGEINGNVKSGRYAFEVKALPNYAFEVVREQCIVTEKNNTVFYFDRSKNKFNSNVKGLTPSIDRASLALPAVGGEARFAPILKTLTAMRVYSLEPTKIREMQDPDSGTGLRVDGSNAASVLQEIERQSKTDLEHVCEILETIVPNTKLVKTIKHGKKLSLEFLQEWGATSKTQLRFEAFNMSDGTLRALGILMAVYQRPTPSVVVIEEPESTIHPGALGAILDVLRHASERAQVIVTTHSPDVLDAEWIKDNNIRIVNWQQGATRLSALSDSSRAAIQAHLMGAGELLRSNALEPELFDNSPLQGELFEEIHSK